MAAPWENIDVSQTRKYQETFKRLLFFQFQDDEQTRTTLNFLLDDIVSVDVSSCPLQGNMKESALLAKLTRQVPFHHDRLVAKICILICFFCGKKTISLQDSDADCIVRFLVEGLKRCQKFVHSHLIKALSAVCAGNAQKIQKQHDTLFGAKGILLQLTDYTLHEEEVVVGAVKCIAAITNVKPQDYQCFEVCHLSACLDTLVHMLHRTPHLTMAVALQHKLLVYCFTGIQNIIGMKRLPNLELGILFAAVRAYIFYGLTSHAVNIPEQLYPTMVTPLVSVATGKTLNTQTPATPKSNDTQNATLKSESDKSKGRRNRKKRGKGVRDADVLDDTKVTGDVIGDVSCFGNFTESTESWEKTWFRVSSSDSEFSETEGSGGVNHRSDSIRVRQSALTCLLHVIRVIDKKVMFGFWSSFIPDAGASSPNTQSLFTTVLKDPSPKCRLAAVACLSNMMESTRPLLVAAEELSTGRPAFSTFSSILGSMVREIHRCLLQALVAENYKDVITQIIKCLGSLVNNAPYHRLNPGLLTRVLKHVRHFFNHKDPNIRTACLTCIGSMVGIKPPLLEVSELIKPPRPPVGTSRSQNPGDSPLLRPEDAAFLLYPVYMVPNVANVPEEMTENDTKIIINKESCLPDVSNLNLESESRESQNLEKDLNNDNSCESRTEKQNLCESEKEKGNVEADVGGDDGRGCSVNGGMSSEGSVESLTPVLGAQSGSDTPIFSDRVLQAQASQTSWVIKLCVKSIHNQPENHRDAAFARQEPLPIRLEALQVLSNLIKNYFPIIRNSFPLLQDLTQTCFEDTNLTIVYHGTKVLEELTQALEKEIQDASIAPMHVIPKQQIVEFWQSLLEGPLTKLLIYDAAEKPEGSNFVCSGACECMANIGDAVFSQLPRPRQMQCVTLILGLAGEENRLVKASAIRALGVYVSYTALKDDVAFVMDAAKSILSAMAPVSNSVRLKASWALANLCDTLVDNKLHNPDPFVEDFPDSVLLELLQCAGRFTKETDKISCNAARAAGNLLLYLPQHCFNNSDILEAVDVAVKGMSKNMSSRTMKVRWNSCYAASNVFKNSHFPVDKPWRKDILLTLCKVVHSCTNFKVRINAALAISSPSSREGYCTSDVFASIWSSLVTSLETSENISDFAEFRYKDSLIEHLCGAILHLMNLTDLADLGSLMPHVTIQGHTLRTYMEKYSHMTLSDKTVNTIPSLEAVKTHLKSMLGSVGDVDKRCVHLLVQTMEQDSDVVDEPLNFKQTYD